MKYFFILSMCLLCISSCSKDDETSSSTATFSMKINNVLWTSNTVNNMIDISSENAILNAVNSSAGEVFGFTIDDFNKVGDYPTVKGASYTAAFYTRKDKVIFNASTEIQYKVTQIDGSKFHGTFSGTMKSTSGEVITITEGKF